MPQPLLKPTEQGTVATAIAVLLAVALVAWMVAGGRSGRLIEIDEAEPVPYAFMVDVNSATWPELAQLPEIGEILARRIVETREQRGPYRTREDLMEVSGIGRVKLSRMAPHLLPLPDERAVAGP
ncbi:helix-hairpin-helix domain-containing protein [Aeoliella sp. ICT_H6.2]|uniref:Helix-hairpin-helix domain-containing protein n=1 Tax=Aeoliella straminimaris TaxID=2954799 RepID=A0A9X2FGV8_9BACT|nr:helix-hairpin-helix domain-containing protein [Aeoliella straminimaris]MCO6046279.1 helix-hairpin-helix domain-containing protein [Aeoliella straminimaris]